MSASARPTSPTQASGHAWLDLQLPWHGRDRAGEPLELRHAEARDAAAWVDHLRRITTETPWMLQSGDDPLPTSLEQRTLLEEYVARPGSLAVVATRPPVTGKPTEILGTLTLASGRSRRNEHSAELSMGVGKQWWGRGIGAILMGAGLTFAAQNHILRRVSLSVFQDNEVARRLYERVGFATEGVLRRYVRWNGRYEDLVVMGLWLGVDR